MPVQLFVNRHPPICCSPATAYKDTTETVTSSTALQNDNELFLPMLANTTYEFELLLFVSATSGPAGLRLAVNGPAGFASLRVSAVVFNNTSDSISNIGVVTAYNTAMTSPTNTGSTVARMYGTVENGATAGNLVLRWAQHAVIGGNSTSILRGSYMILRKT